MRWRAIVGLIAVVGLLVPQTLAAQDNRPGLAVLPFENGGSYGQDKEDFDALEIGIQQMLLTEFAVNSGLRVVERQRIKALMQEQDLGTSGRVDQNTAARIGKLVGARYMVLGGFVDFYGDLRIDARVVNVETGEIVKSERVRNKREQLYDSVVELAQNVSRGLDLPSLSRQARQERQDREVPAGAVRLYVKGLLYQDRGDRERAAELFQQAIAEFPDYTEAKEALRQSGAS
jgi:TolB-like protein